MDIIEKLMREELKQANVDIAAAHDALVDKQDRRNLPESIFKEEFLPYFAGQKDIRDQPNVLEQWMTVAGNAFAEVNLIDQSGKVTAIVPGISSTLHLQISSGSVNLSDACRQSQLVGSQIPALGVRFFQGALDARQQELVDSIVPDTINVAKTKWEAVFNHFGVDLTAKTENAITSKEEQRLDDDVSFE